MDAVFDASGQLAAAGTDTSVEFGHYMMLADTSLNLFSVFDDLGHRTFGCGLQAQLAGISQNKTPCRRANCIGDFIGKIKQ